MKIKSLKSRKDSLAQTEKQLAVLNGGIFKDGTLPKFTQKVKSSNLKQVRPSRLEILQINIGYMCNQVCAHCHEIGRAHVRTPVTEKSRMPSSA